MSQDHENQYQPPHQVEQGDSTGGIIPYKNGPALIAYYLGIFSIIPGIGLVLAIPAVVMGIMGLKKRRANPVIKGAAHAWVGIIMGGIFTLIWGGGLVLFIGSIVARS